MLQMMITKGAVTVSYTAMYTYTSELFPTVIRNTAVGCCSTIARVGAIMSSYMALWLVRFLSLYYTYINGLTHWKPNTTGFVTLEMTHVRQTTNVTVLYW